MSHFKFIVDVVGHKDLFYIPGSIILVFSVISYLVCKLQVKPDKKLSGKIIHSKSNFTNL